MDCRSLVHIRSLMTVVVATCFCTLLLGCISGAAAQEDGDVRLVGGLLVNEGRVEVYYEGQWGTVCDDSWSTVDADAVCKQLGFDSAERIFYRAEYGEGSGPIWIDQINCPAEVRSILNCNHNGWGSHDCRHSEDAGVKCKRLQPVKPAEMPVRISCPDYYQDGSCKACSNKRYPSQGECAPTVAVQGVVEAFYDDEWRPVSLDGWNRNSAKVVCNQLGYPEAYGSPSLANLWTNWDGLHCGSINGSDGGVANKSCSLEEIQENKDFRKRLGSTLLKKLDCTGAEGRLLDCYFQEFGPNENLTLHQVATVRCGFRPHSSCFAEEAFKETYRTRAGAVPWAGRLEVKVNGEWGTVCDSDFDMKEAHIVCRAMGYGSAKSYQVRASYGKGVGTIHYSNLRCKGNERYLADCEKQTGHRAQSCGHRGDVSIECTLPQPCDDNKVARLKPVQNPKHPSHYDSFMEVKGPYGWGLLCMDSMNMNAASVVCKENKELFALGVRRGNHGDYEGVRYAGKVECVGDEEGMHLCSVFVLKVAVCPQGDAIVDCTANLPDLVPDLAQFQSSLESVPYVDLLPMYYLTCALDENCLSSSAKGQPYNHYRSLLRFNSQTDNLGTTDFRPVLNTSEWIWHSCHNHFHSFEAFIHYDLLNKTTGEKVAEGHKASFCLEDTSCVDGVPNYRCSGTGAQGISRNCGDLYGRHLDCQWIDITDVPAGTYQLRQQVNPDRLSAESDYRNNIISCDITLFPGSGYTYFTVTNFKLSDH